MRKIRKRKCRLLSRAVDSTGALFMKIILLCSLLLVFLPGRCRSLETSPDDFMKRRTTLMEQAKTGIIILFGEADRPTAQRFRQDNDFYYFSGIEDVNAILAMIPGSRETALFLPRLTEWEVKTNGKNLLDDPAAFKKTGLDEIFPLDYLGKYIAIKSVKLERTFHVRLSAADSVGCSRRETEIFAARRARNSFNDQVSLNKHRIEKLKKEFPGFKLKDATPFIDAMRIIKSTREIEILRRNGKISAGAVKQAMLTAGPGIYEYELEAAVMNSILKNGARGTAFPTVVGSGGNSCIYHYNKNRRRMKAGDIVVLDFGADLEYQAMDITRTWPVSGVFTAEQRKIYRTVLEYQEACIAAFRPGTTPADVRRHAEKVMKEKKIDIRGMQGLYPHFVGMSVHDVGARGMILREGMVIAFEPGLYYPERNLGVRIEDTILITRDGCEVLSQDAPKEIAEIEALLAGKKREKIPYL